MPDQNGEAEKAPPKGEKIMAKRVFIIVLDSFGIGRCRTPPALAMWAAIHWERS